MNEMPPRNKFVEPHDPDPREYAESILLRAGWDKAEVAWLLPALLAVLSEEASGNDGEALLSGREKLVLEELGRAKAQLGDTAAVLVFATRIFEQNLCPPVSSERWSRVLVLAHAKGVDLTSGLSKLRALALAEPRPEVLRHWMNSGDQGLGYLLRSLAKQLHDAGVADFASMVRWEPSHDPDAGDGWAPQKWPTDARLARLVDPGEMSFWLHALGEDAVAGLVRALSDWMTSYCEPQGLKLPHFGFAELPRLVRIEVERLFFSAEPHLVALSKDSTLAIPLLLRLARMAFELRSEHLAPETRKALLRLAGDSLSKLRPLLRQAHTREAALEFSGHPTASLREDAVFMLFEFGTLWEAWKPLLLAFRALSAPALSPELSFFEKAPHPWSIIPSSIVMLFHHRARKEQDRDPTLKALRSEFGQFCLDSLKTVKHRKPKEGPVGHHGEAAQLREPSADWRYGYIRALLELRINPEGDGHHVLRWVADNDPDEEVKEAASKAYNEVRRGDRLGDMSPRRAILQAFWWLEQAHMLALGQDVDGPGAQRTREWMVRMTTEKREDHSKAV
jgi:hypothetical protein